MGNRPSRTTLQSLPRPDGVSSTVSVSVPETTLEGVELESLLPITGSRYAVHLMPAHTEAWVTGPQAASINKRRLLDKHRLLEGYTGYDLASGTYGSQQQPQNASSTFVPVAMPLLSSYVLREPLPLPPPIPGHTAHSSLALLHQRMHADESADFDETVRVVVPCLSATATSAPPESSTLATPALPALPALPAPVSPYVNLRVVPERVVASLAFDGEDNNSVGHAWRVKLALERMLVEDQLLLPRTNSTSAFTGTGGSMGNSYGSGTGMDSDVEWMIAQYKYAPLAVTRTSRLTGANRSRYMGRDRGAGSGSASGGGSAGGGSRRSEIWVVLDAANNPRVKAAVDLERRKINTRIAGSSSGATVHVGASAPIGSSGSLLSAWRTGYDNASLPTHPRSVVV